jgi:hypothetical protein
MNGVMDKIKATEEFNLQLAEIIIKGLLDIKNYIKENGIDMLNDYIDITEEKMVEDSFKVIDDLYSSWYNQDKCVSSENKEGGLKNGRKENKEKVK